MQDAVRAAHFRPAHTMFRGTQGTGPSWGPTRTPCALTPGSGSSVVAAADADWPTGTARTHGPGQRALCQWVAGTAPCVATAHAWGAFSPRDDTYTCVSGPLPHAYPWWSSTLLPGCRSTCNKRSLFARLLQRRICPWLRATSHCIPAPYIMYPPAVPVGHQPTRLRRTSPAGQPLAYAFRQMHRQFCKQASGPGRRLHNQRHAVHI